MGLASYYSGKRVLVTGGCGTIGKELIDQLLKQNPQELRVVDNNEEGIFFLDQKYHDFRNINITIGDIRDAYKMQDVLDGIQVVFHTAALKHVAICEHAPLDAVMTNIMGVKNIIRASLNSGVSRVIFTSTDKAVNPTNVMGTSKLMGERLITAANNYAKDHNVVFSSTRFGNVLASRGSVVQVFYKQIKNGGPLTVTDPKMTRFIMTIEESVRLVLAAGLLAKGGEVFVTKMPVVRIKDLAEVMIEMLAPKFGHNPDNIELKYVGSRPGEKLYEELMTSEEATRAVELEDMYSVLPSFRPLYKKIDFVYSGFTNNRVEKAYDSHSQKVLGKHEIGVLLKENLNNENFEEIDTVWL